MINVLFHIPLFYYEVKEWDRKKKALLSRINQNKFDYYGAANFQTDRHSKKNKYALDFENIFDEELTQFKEEAKLSYLKVKDIWTLKYSMKHESHCPHNHASTGYTGILYLEHDPKEGVMYIWPSVLLHYVDGMNSKKTRMITSWDMDVN